MPPLNSRTERPRKSKIGRMVACHASIPRTYLDVKRSKFKVTRQINARTNIFQMERPTNFKLGTQTEHEDTASRTSAVTSKVKVQVARSRDTFNKCWTISRERNVIETLKLVERLSTRQAMKHTSFSVKGQRSSQFYRPLVHALSTVMTLQASIIEACEVGLHAGGGIKCRPHPAAATQIVEINLLHKPIINAEYTKGVNHLTHLTRSAALYILSDDLLFHLQSGPCPSQATICKNV